MKWWLSPHKGAACLCAHCGSVGRRKADRRGTSTGSEAKPGREGVRLTHNIYTHTLISKPAQPTPKN